ncbi:MAG TPA: biotin--[acetyl-CoA-carboxylase] ligase [Anaerolineae bacterium]|nr:biotin--[acetyl-CoA-carboxylase] ligase [Anaerolineae bacterium]
MIDDLQETAVIPTLNTQWIGKTYIYLNEVDSTNEFLKVRVAEGNVPAGTVVATDFQSRGKGRLQRRWEALPGTSLLLSLLFKPDWPAEQANWLTMITSVAMAEAGEGETAVPVRIKWPNDLVIKVEDVWHKVGGLLLEGDVGADGRIRSVVLGIGLNVNIPPEQLPTGATPPTSLLAVLGRPVSRQALLVDFLQRVEMGVATAVSGQSPQAVWQKRLITLGQPVQVTHTGTNQAVSGVAEGADAFGHLLVRDGAGRLHTVTAGDVTLRQPKRQFF